MGVSWGLETRVLKPFVIECLSCSLLPPQKNKKIKKAEIKRFQTQEKKTRKKKNVGKRTTQRRNIHKSSLTKTQKKALCWKFYPAHFLNKSFKPS